MNFGINLLYLSNNTHSGSAKHAESLLLGFRKQKFLDCCTLFVRSSYVSTATSLFPEAKIVEVKPSGIIKYFLALKHRNHSFYESYYLNKHKLSYYVKKECVDLMLHPFNESTTRLIKGTLNICVIHELFYEHHPDYYGRILYHYAYKKHKYFVTHATVLIATSEYTKSNILETYKKASSSSIYVIPNAITVPLSFTDFVPVDGPYLLSMVSSTYQRNTITLLKAYNLIKRRVPHQLVLVGRLHEEADTINTYIKEHDLRDRVLCMEGVPDELCNSLYRNASLLITPSLFGNSGRTQIEAALVKTPVITSKTGSLTEVTLGLLNYYEPATDYQALAMKIIDVLKNPASIDDKDAISSTYTRIYNDEMIASRYYQLFTDLCKLT